MTTYTILITALFLLTTIALGAQLDRCQAQAHLIIELKRRVQLEQEAVKLANARADTLTLALRQAQAWLN